MTAEDGTLRTSAIDQQQFRHVLGHFPTGVAVITGMAPGGEPAGLAVGSFTSVSLDPPYVAFMPDKTSSSFPRIGASGSFCVNVLSADQELVCRRFAAQGGDKFTGLAWRTAPSGSPILQGVVAWIDCDIETIHEAGDHDIVIGRVRDLATESGAAPLVFFQAGYGRFSSGALAAPTHRDLLEPLRLVDVARPWMERLAAEIGAECMASAVVGDQLVIVGSTMPPGSAGMASRIGQRMPFVAPLAAPLVAWAPDAEERAWTERVPGLDAAQQAVYRGMLEVVRRRGWSIALASEQQIALEATVAAMPVESPTAADIDAVQQAAYGIVDGYEPVNLPSGELHVRHLSAPISGPDGSAVLMLSLYQLPHGMLADQVGEYARKLRATSDLISIELRQSPHRQSRSTPAA